ncbi:hypothetical protein ACSU1G_33525 [Microbacterium sp. A93]
MSLSSCASATSGDADATSPIVEQEQEQEQSDPVVDTSEDDDASSTVIPAGARPASAAFPFPMPEDWPELDAFAEEKIGKDIAMSGTLSFPGDAQSASATYQKLLEDAGYEIHANPLGEQVHLASFVVKGKVDGTGYSGTIDFDTDAADTPRTVINLTED